MPIHDWTRVDAGLFHAFHQGWTIGLSNALNTGVLPPDYFALPEQDIRGPIPDVLTLQLSPNGARTAAETGGVAVATAPPRATLIQRTEEDRYADRANRISIRHRHGTVVAVVEIVSPGNKSSRAAFRRFVEKAGDLLGQGVHLLVIDLFPPGSRDPEGVHAAIWDDTGGATAAAARPADKPLTVAAYDAGPPTVAYVNLLAVGDPLPDAPIFLRPEHYVPAPLEATYQETWRTFPNAVKPLLQ